MDGSFSPIVMKIAGEVAGKGRKWEFCRPTDVCLEDWWLSKLDDDKGIAVGSRPVERTRCDNVQKEFHSAPTKKRYASREFHSAQVVKRHSGTTVETSDGLFVFLFGFMNRSRTQQNGFSSEDYYSAPNSAKKTERSAQNSLQSEVAVLGHISLVVERMQLKFGSKKIDSIRNPQFCCTQFE